MRGGSCVQSLRLYDVDSFTLRVEVPSEAALLDCCFQNESVAFTACSDCCVRRFVGYINIWTVVTGEGMIFRPYPFDPIFLTEQIRCITLLHTLDDATCWSPNFGDVDTIWTPAFMIHLEIMMIWWAVLNILLKHVSYWYCLASTFIDSHLHSQGDPFLMHVSVSRAVLVCVATHNICSFNLHCVC